MSQMRSQNRQKPYEIDRESGNASTAIAQHLRERILTGELKPEARLNLRETAAEYGLSYMPARDAVKELIRDGLVMQSGPRTIVVAPLKVEDFVDIMDLRMMLEPRALELSAPRLSKHDLLEVETALARKVPANDLLALAEAHYDFHTALYKRAGRPRLLATIAHNHRHLLRYLTPQWAAEGVRGDWAADEAELFQYVAKKRFKEAVSFLRRDLEAALLRVLKTLPI